MRLASACRWPAVNRGLFELCRSRLGPSLCFGGEPIQEPLHIAAIRLETFAVEIRRHFDCGAEDRAPARSRPRDSKPVPRFQSPWPIVADPRTNQRQPKLRSQIDWTDRRFAPRPARTIR